MFLDKKTVNIEFLNLEYWNLFGGHFKNSIFHIKIFDKNLNHLTVTFITRNKSKNKKKYHKNLWAKFEKH